MKKTILLALVAIFYGQIALAQSAITPKPSKKMVETAASPVAIKTDSLAPKKTQQTSSKAVKAAVSRADLPPSGQDIYLQALALYKNNKFDLALKSAQQSTTMGIGEDAFYLMALCHKKLDSDPMTQQRAFEAVLNVNPLHFNALTQLGIVYFNQKKFTEAITYFEKALTVVPSDKEIKSYLEMSKKAADRVTKGKTVTFKSEKENEKNGTKKGEKLEKNDALVADEELKEVKPEENKSKTEKPKGDKGLTSSDYIKNYNEGVKMMNSESFDLAAAAFEKAAAIAPTDAKTQYLLAYCLSNIKGEEAQTTKAAQKASSLNENDGKLQFDIGNIYFKLAQKDETITAYKRAYKLGYRNTDLYSQLGFAFFYNNDQDNAIKWFEQAIASDPENPVIAYNLGTAYLNASKLEHAEKTLEKAIQLDPSNKEAYYNYGKTLLQQEKPDEALATAKTCMSIDIDYAKAYILAAEAYKKLGNTPEYNRHLKRAKQLDPKIKMLFER